MPKSKKKKQLETENTEVLTQDSTDTKETNQKDDDLQLSDQDISQIMDLRAKKLGVLLATSTMPDEVKEAWVALLPELSLSQLDRLTNILEAEYLNNGTAPIDEFYSTKWKEAKEEYFEAIEKIEDDAREKVAKFQNIQKELH